MTDPMPGLNMRRLRSRRLLARLAIRFEQVWPALWPPLGVLGLFICAGLLSLPQSLPPLLQFCLLAAVVAGIIGLGWRGLRGLRAPDDAGADRRLERASGLRHRPLAVLTDRPAGADQAGADAGSAALWRLHAERAARQIGKLRIGLPRPGLARRDPRALRVALLVLLVTCLVIAGGRAPARLAGAVLPAAPPGTGEPATELQAWITPPGYTGLPPIFLKPGGGSADAPAATVLVPAGAHLTVSLTGGAAEPTLGLGPATEAFRRLDTESWQADRDLTAGGRLTIRRDGRDLAAWEIALAPDRPPTIAWAEAPGRANRGLQLRLPWQTADDYGVASVQAELRLRDRPDAPPIVLGIPLPGGQPKTAHGVQVQDLVAHPWAGLPIRARLLAKDAPGQTGISADAEFLLPMRMFRNAAARALIGARQLLSVNPEDRRQAVETIEQLLAGAPLPGALPGAPPGPEANPNGSNGAASPADPLGNDAVAAVQLGAVAGLLKREPAPRAVDEAQSRLWDLALRLEEGAAERTARALDKAREEARTAMNEASRVPDASRRAELEKKLQELQQAIDKHMQALADQMRREQTERPHDRTAQALTQQQMQQKAQAAEQAAREGRMDEAKDKMAELEQMLDELKQARRNGKPQADPQKAERRQNARKQVSAAQDLIKREGVLLDHTQSRASGGQLDSLTGRPLPPPPLTADRLAVQQNDALVQKALRRALGELMQQFGDLTSKIPPALGRADTAMREAAQALAGGQDPAAVEAEQRAIAALQESGREMNQQITRQFGPGQRGEGQEPGEQQESDQAGEGSGMQDDHSDAEGQSAGAESGQRGHSERRDPLGRQMGQGATGADEGSDVQVPEEMERQRTRAIQDELRRRGGQRSRPQEELDYIDRLLKQF